MIELFPNIDHIPLPAKVLCQPEHVDAALAGACAAFGKLAKNLSAADGVPLLLFESQAQQQQQ